MPTIHELSEIYNLQNVTVVADKGMNSAQNKDYVKYQNMHYIFPIRLKGESHKFKQYVVSETDYQKVDGLLYKEIQQVDDREENRIKYRRIVIYDTWKAKRDKILRKEVLDRFDKIKGKDGTATAKAWFPIRNINSSKKFKNQKIAIDEEMLKEDAKLDGYVAFETTRYDLTAREIVDIYKKQWTIERKFQNLKSTLDARPMYVRTDNHIFGHITICFLGLVVLNYLTWYINHKQKDKWGVLDRVTPSQIIESIKVAKINFTKVDGKITYSSSWDNEIFRNEIELYREIKMLVSDGFFCVIFTMSKNIALRCRAIYFFTLLTWKHRLMRAMNSLAEADLSLIVIDATQEEVSHFDSRIIGYALEHEKPVIIVINKWDLVEKETNTMAQYEKKLRNKFHFVPWVPFVFISAKYNQRLNKLYDTINMVRTNLEREIKPAMLSNLIMDIQMIQPAVPFNGGRLNIYFVRQEKGKIPTFTFFVNNKKYLHFSYQRFLENQLRETFDFRGCPIKMNFKNKQNAIE
ncbi:transposase [Mycoplasmopsis verecunda]|nr:transposase [Mycoplasmopsis verecunda]WPB54916.1 transposase [Mycoplasmopsis verecunda]